MKSSLRRPSGPCAFSSSSYSSSSLPVRKTEEKSTAANKSQDKPPNPEQPKSCYPVRDISRALSGITNLYCCCRSQRPVIAFVPVSSFCRKVDSQPIVPECKTEEAEPAQEVITHPDGKVRRWKNGRRNPENSLVFTGSLDWNLSPFRKFSNLKSNAAVLSMSITDHVLLFSNGQNTLMS